MSNFCCCCCYHEGYQGVWNRLLREVVLSPLSEDKTLEDKVLGKLL